MKLFVSGMAFNKGLGEPAICSLIRAKLDKAKNGELFKTAQICTMTGKSQSHVRQATVFLGDYSAKHRTSTYWGNKKTIAHFKKELSI